jgi:hypothetical protein
MWSTEADRLRTLIHANSFGLMTGLTLPDVHSFSGIPGAALHVLLFGLILGRIRSGLSFMPSSDLPKPRQIEAVILNGLAQGALILMAIEVLKWLFKVMFFS